MAYFFIGPDSKQKSEIEEAAKVDPDKATKDYKLRKYSMGKSYFIISKLPNMRSHITTMFKGSLKGAEEKAFLDAIKAMKD